MQVTVLLFGSLREATGVKELAVALPDGARVADLSALLAREHAVFAALPARVKVAVKCGAWLLMPNTQLIQPVSWP